MIICIKSVENTIAPFKEKKVISFANAMVTMKSQKYKKQSIRKFYDKRMTLKCFFLVLDNLALTY